MECLACLIKSSESCVDCAKRMCLDHVFWETEYYYPSLNDDNNDDNCDIIDIPCCGPCSYTRLRGRWIV